ncbi:hypothetical protein P691DRAFT_760555 [Macrolepiota fuliginosa MF-IS2]|uniref:RING-type domain-containing protein n=1 Tax=Macrolepiota fuliginosa MF-IS2 TaxID=1400762 RepID=A0A9P5XCA2_9AGAR|nr:hypothetical protein P691DRAFT_760555 [Macrolepiota fuliginosa MF-IS2]
MSPLQPAFHSYSVPTSPAVSRLSKHSPVTPQRAPRQQHRHTQSFYRSPITPSTPYTPLSLHSSDSNNSSTLTTPDNLSLNLKKRITFVSGSPEISRAPNGSQEKSIADVADNWRSRANENGIRVSSTDQNVDEQHYEDDEGILLVFAPDVMLSKAHIGTEFSVSDPGNDSSILLSDALLPPFLSKPPEHPLNHGSSRPRTQSQNSFIFSAQPLSPTLRRNSGRSQAPQSPLRTRQSQNQPMSLLSTPPPNRNLVKQLKQNGSLTDPAHTRRREAFGVVRTPQNTHSSFNLGYSNDMSMELFDIDEHEYEQDTSHDIPHEDESFSLNLQAHQANTFGYLNYSYPSFPQYTSDPFQSTGIQFGYGNPSNIADSVDHHFHSFQQQQNAHRYDLQAQPTKGHKDTSRKIQPMVNAPPYIKPTQVPVPPADISLPVLHRPTPLHPSRNANSMILPTIPDLIAPEPSNDCSVCLCLNPARLAVLKPCGHPLCSACLTSALNIVGEKDMECAVCKQGVEDFKLIVNPRSKTNVTSKDAQKDSTKGKSFFDPIFSSPSSSSTIEGNNTSVENDSFGDLDTGFDFGIDFSPHEIRASTPKLENSMSFDMSTQPSGNAHQVPSKDSTVVLRIDNVPWDITPSQAVAWLQQPVERVHVLLDSKGKTLSHAYIEIKDQQIAGAILRGEAVGPDGKKKERGSVLGRGRRARGVTITRSGQEELMADLFPQWRGGFDGSRPSLAGLQGERIINALEGGLLTENEITGLLYLIREPDSHFLKVPSLPFHSLISILSKFPADVDSRVFWSSGIRDMLFDVTFAALETLLSRLETLKNDTSVKSRNGHGYSMDLVAELIKTALRCQAFTSQHASRLVSFASSKSIPVAVPVNAPQESTFSSGTAMSIDAPNQTRERFGDLAKEFGVETELVQALAQRLANLT